MRLQLISSIVALLLLIPAIGSAAESRLLLLALSKADHTLAIVDPESLKVLSRVSVGADPHEVIASPDGKIAYATNYGGGRFHEINVIDLVKSKALTTIDTGAMLGPHGLAFVGDNLWFTAEGSKAIGRIARKTQAIDWIMGTGQNRTHMIYVTPDKKQIYTTNVESGTVSLFENSLVKPPPPPNRKPFPGAKEDMEWTQTVLNGAKGNEGFDVSPDGKELWTATPRTGEIFIIDIAAKKVTATVDAKVMGANRLKFTPDGKHVLVSSLQTGDLYVLDASTHKEVEKIKLGKGAAGILVEPSGARAFIGCTGDDYVAIVDLKKMEVSGHLDVGGMPDGLAWAARP